jgi:hypothetical protein
MGIDANIRLAAFQFLEEQTRLSADDGALRRTILSAALFTIAIACR